ALSPARRGRGRQAALDADTQSTRPVPGDEPIPAALGALARRDARDRGEVGRGAEVTPAAVVLRTRGLDPRVHRLRKKLFTKPMDCRVKPGNDRGWGGVSLHGV